MPASSAASGWLLFVLAGFAGAGGLQAAEPAEEFGFFDYLGTMVEDDGEWLDPLAMEADLQPQGADAPEHEASDVNTKEAPQGEDDE